MAGFKFPLEQVLRYRNQLEDQAKMAFAKVRGELVAHIEKLKALRYTLQTQENLPYKDPHEYWLRSNFIRSLQANIDEAEMTKQRLEVMVERYRLKLVVVSQERQLLDKLKDKQAERYAHEQGIKEKNSLDEIAGIRHEAKAV